MYRIKDDTFAPLYANGGLLFLENPFNTKMLNSAYVDKVSKKDKSSILTITQDDIADFAFPDVKEAKK